MDWIELNWRKKHWIANWNRQIKLVLTMTEQKNLNYFLSERRKTSCITLCTSVLKQGLNWEQESDAKKN